MTSLLVYVYLGSALAAWMMIEATGRTTGLFTQLMILMYPVTWPVILLEALRRYYAN